MLAREVMYFCMTNKQLNKRIEKMAMEIKTTSDPKKKIKNLRKTTDLVKAVIYKNRKNGEFMSYVSDELCKLQNTPNVKY